RKTSPRAPTTACPSPSGRGDRKQRTQMNCRHFRFIVHDLGRPGALEDSVAKAGFAHAESCAPCAEYLGDSRSLDGALRGLASDAGEEAPFHVEATLLAAFRRSAAT